MRVVQRTSDLSVSEDGRTGLVMRSLPTPLCILPRRAVHQRRNAADADARRELRRLPIRIVPAERPDARTLDHSVHSGVYMRPRWAAPARRGRRLAPGRALQAGAIALTATWRSLP